MRLSPANACRLDLITQQPLFWAACAYAGGIILASLLWRPASWWLIAALAFLGSSAVLLGRRPGQARVLLLCAFVFLGALHFESAAATQTPSPDVTTFSNGDEVVVTAHVVRTGLPRRAGDDSSAERREVIDVETEAIEGPWGRKETSFGVRLTVRSQLLPNTIEEGDPAFASPLVTSFTYGERIRFPTKLREPRNYGNPGAMDYRAYLRGKGIAALASVSVEKFEKLEGQVGSRWGAWRSRSRTRLAEAMLASTGSNGSWSTLSEEDKGLLLAMVIGEQSLLERTTRSDFQKTGVFHILVVSGMNVGMLAWFVFWAMRRLRAAPWIATGITVTICLAYVAVTDLGTPVLRAAMMLCLYLVARMLYRDQFSLNAVGTAAGLLLLYAPESVFEPSFQLTFLSMVALSGVVQPILEATSGPYEQALRGLELTGYDLTLEPRLAQFRLDLRLISQKAARLLMPKTGAAYASISWLLTRCIGLLLSIYDVLVVSVVMQLALALPMTVYFHRLALLAVPTNILVVPLTAILVPVALLATLLQLLSASAASLIWSLTALCIHAMTLAVRSAAGLRFGEVRLAVPEFTLCLVAAALFGSAVLFARGKRWRVTGAVASLVLGALIVTFAPRPRLVPGVMEVTVIDVGQGDSILLVTPDGKTLLVDSGGPAGPFRTDNFDIGEDVVSPYLWSRGITRLDVVAVTHAHSDHLAGMPAIIANFRPKEVWLGAESQTEGYERLRKSAARYQAAVKHYVAGEEIKLGATEIRVLNPPPGFIAGSRRNEDSLVLQVTYGESSALLTGDAEKKTEEILSVSAARASLLKVAHHGSGTSTTPELLKRTKPPFAVISAGYRNLYGHPRADVLARLRAARVRTYRTDIQGAVTFYLDGKDIRPAPPR